jgi:hypothetical protein
MRFGTATGFNDPYANQLVRMDEGAAIPSTQVADSIRAAQQVFGEDPTLAQTIKPRRRLGDGPTDRADGLSSLIAKARVLSVEPSAGTDQPSALAIASEISTYVEALYTDDLTSILRGIKGLRRYVCGSTLPALFAVVAFRHLIFCHFDTQHRQ